jgi:hypothetical protein
LKDAAKALLDEEPPDRISQGFGNYIALIVDHIAKRASFIERLQSFGGQARESQSSTFVKH